MKKKLLIFLLFACLVSFHGNTIVTVNFVQTSDLLQEINKKNQDFSISPNPATSKLKINLKVVSPKTMLTVFDVLGKKILSIEISQLQSTIDVSQWNNGVYLVRVTSDKITQTKRFVKQ